MTDLNTLSNKQLHQKCLEYGLPNVPITDSTRKVLIKRLNNIMQGKDNSKASSPANRRKTVAATATTIIEDGHLQATTNRSNNNIKGRRTVGHAEKNTTVASNRYNQTVTPIELDIENRASSTKINYEPQQRRSVSLSKTGVLTTSYNQEIAPMQTNYEEMQDEVDEIEMDTTHANPYTSSTNYTQSSYNSSNYNAGNYATLAMPPPVEPSIPKLYPNLNNTGLQTDYYGLDDMLASHSSSVRQSKLGFTYNPPTSYVPPSTSPTSYVSPSKSPLQRNTTANPVGALDGRSYGSQFSSSSFSNNASSNIHNASTNRYNLSSGVTKRHTARSIDDEGGASSSDDGQYEAPYLNKFSRKLDLRSDAHLAHRSPTSSYGASSSPMGRYSPAITKKRRSYDDNGITFAQFWASLEQKYHLKTAIMLGMCFFAAVFIYVFFLR